MGKPNVLRTRARRVLAFAGLLSLSAATLILPAATNSAAQATRPAGPSARQQATLAGASKPHGGADSPVTVPGPFLYDPSTGKQLPNRSSVTVSQTSNLVDQLVHVSWSNFTPTNDEAAGPWYVNNASYYSVMAVECRGTDPTSYTDCYEADSEGLQLPSGNAGPPNDTYAITTSQGTGQLNFEVETSLVNSVLACDQNHPCSLVIVPGQGGIPGQCSDHSDDIGLGRFNALAQNTFSFSSPSADGACSWNDRIVIPLQFAPSPSGCPQREAAFSAAGSPMMEVAMQRWQAGLCAGSNGLTIGFDAASGEPAAITNVADGLTDVAFTTRPASADQLTTGTRHKFGYAPIAVSAATIAYWLDENSTGQPFSGLKLNQDLLAKLITTSYNPHIACNFKPQPQSCDNGVDNNPFSLLWDPEFKSLNPSIAKATDVEHRLFLGLYPPDIVLGTLFGLSDMTWATTSYLHASTGTASFLTGGFDPWGEHVNSYYLGVQFPTNQFLPQDPASTWSNENTPASPLTQLVTDQALNTDVGSDFPTQQPGGGVVLGKDPPQPLGDRALFALLDEGDAALNDFPTAAIPNAAGDYVQPTGTAMAAAVKDMVSDGDGTLQMNLADKDPAAYPLTMVIYAMVPISGEPHAKAAAIARFLNFTAGPGQTPGVQPGQLAAGYLPLPASLRAQTRKVATEVLNQTGDSTSGSPGGGGGGSGGGGSGGGGSTGSGSGSTSPSGKTSPGATGPSGPTHPVTLVDAHTGPASISRLILPGLLVVGALLALCGSSALMGAADGGLPGVLARARRRTAGWTHRVSQARNQANQPWRKP